MARKSLVESASTPKPQSTTVGYTVLARRYRPQQFADLAGQEPVAEALTNAIKGDRVAHAYLFTGARGVGKTSTARILAKALNCVQGPTPTPCDKCESCLAIAVGEDIDVLEIDGASNNKVEEIRELRQNAQFRPSRSKFKIYIIDEVHMLTTAAFNALLKTLEEPPPHVKFIFATTEEQKVPVTILSRCQRFDFAGIGSAKIVDRLQQILKEEGTRAEDGALELIARRAGGAMRDAQSLLDQLLAFGDGELTRQQIHHLLGTADEAGIAALAGAILGQDIAGSLAKLEDLANQGAQLGEIIDQLMEFWRDLMIRKATAGKYDGYLFGSAFHEMMQEHADGLSLDSILATLDILAATKFRLRTASQGRIIVEMALIRVSKLKNLTALSELAAHLKNGTLPTALASRSPVKKNEIAPKISAPKSAPPRNAPSSRETHPATPQSQPATKPQARPPNNEQEPHQSRELTSTGRVAGLTEETVEAVWQKALASLGPFLQNEARWAVPACPAPNCLVLNFPEAYNRSKEHCQETDALQKLEAALQATTGQPITIRFGVATNGAVPLPAPAPPVSPARQKQAIAEADPLIRAAINQLGARIVKLDPEFNPADPDS